MLDPLKLYERILLKNPSEVHRIRNSTLRGNGLSKLISLFDSNTCFWAQNLPQLLKFSYEFENEFKKCGNVLTKIFMNQDDPHDATIKIMGPFYFPAESGSNEKFKSGFISGIEPKEQMHFLGRSNEILKTSDQRGNLINQTFDSSIFNNPSEKEAFNVSQLNGNRLLNMNLGSSNMRSFRRYDEVEEEYHTGEYSQPNVTSYNGQCPYFVNEKQYDAIIRRRRKKQKRMLLYGKSKLIKLMGLISRVWSMEKKEESEV